MRPFSPAARVLPGSAPRSATPVKSILKTASVLGNRKHRHESSPDAPESPTKRRKVFFDDIRNITYEVGRRTMEEVKLEVRNALEGHLGGQDSRYDTLKEMFANDTKRYLPSAAGEDDTLKPHELQAYVMALTSCVPILKHKDFNGLVRVVLQCSWLGRDDAFVKSFTHFLAALVSAQGSYLGTVLSMIVDKFQLTRQSKWGVPDFPEVTRETMRQRLHSTLLYLLQMFPSAVSVLESILNAKFPFPDDSVQTHMAYINNLLKVKEYMPKLENEILDSILNRVVKIDSQMQLDLEDLDDEITTAVLFALRENPHTTSDWEEDELDESDNESVDSEDLDLDEETTQIKTVKENVDKMDAILDTLFKFYTPYFLNPGSDKAFDAFAIILREFDRIVLPTYKSRHTQFLIFHFAQQHERLTDAFCGQLISTAFQNNTPNVLKQAAAAYLASFVARGARVPRSLVRSIFSLLLVHVENYRRKYEPTCRGPDLKRFHPYYSLVQAILYIFCFRWQDLVVAAPDTVDTDDAASYIGQDLEWVGSARKDLSIQIFGKLNPLKVCAPVIVEEFARLAHRLGFMYIYPLVESNKRVRLTQFISSTYATGGALREAGYDHEESFHQLDPYFPFDPYQLPISKRWLDDDYVHWKSVPGLNADDDSDDSDDMDEEDDNELEEATATDSEGGDYD
ncbi:RNA polymerase I specific transcription initiation factor RRN3 [Cordyceps fumosorosea ARSEF 2679]|uniref:RNA polymerase I specific transcription initiation factor RRN3 n=1 Tax=Cordyceps fumosorosea (strain ARSEF 2679) TaxID=1081104 RepID=A0A167XCH4_CORFA|nr:RNA polymerase I specific transcription initiation factor RRN3 [Cordyceps fumosorosea ARSEF 2679]OAA64804.1 RNA polymerase I specific transcription initiation factor RRN3 [Cordyceps fumosorosea ARSEF 2679]